MLYTMHCIIGRHSVQQARLLVLLHCATCRPPAPVNASPARRRQCLCNWMHPWCLPDASMLCCVSGWIWQVSQSDRLPQLDVLGLNAVQWSTNSDLYWWPSVSCNCVQGTNSVLNLVWWNLCHICLSLHPPRTLWNALCLSICLSFCLSVS